MVWRLLKFPILSGIGPYNPEFQTIELGVVRWEGETVVITVNTTSWNMAASYRLWRLLRCPILSGILPDNPVLKRRLAMSENNGR